MAQIYVEFKQLKSASQDVKKVSKNIKKIQSDFIKRVNQLDWEVRSRENLINRANKLSGELERYSNTVNSYSLFLDSAYEQYNKLDRIPQWELIYAGTKPIDHTVTDNRGPKLGIDPKNLAMQLIDYIKNREKIRDRAFKEVKNILKFLDKAGDIESAGILKDIISYIEKTYGFFTGEKKGWSGAADYCGLFDSSVGLWKGFYDLAAGTLTEAQKKGIKTGLFSKKGETAVAGLNLAGDTFGFLEAIFEANSKFGENDIYNNAANYLESGDELFKVGKDIYGIAKTKVKPGASYLYEATVSGVVDATAQTVRSIGKYSADGKWDSNDTAATGVDMSVAGLYGIVDSLSFGHADFIFHTDNPQDIADGLKGWAEDTGTKIGHFIVDMKKKFK